LSREEILETAVLQALQDYRVDSFAKTVSIGDGLWDVRTARRLGFTFLGVGGGEAVAFLERAGAKHVIEDFADYDRFVNCLNEAEIPGLECL
jgi:phosphoglycolate phosphatase-like HAD superfamily hydrolase